MNVINTTQLCKSYGSHRVLKNVDIAIKSGRLVGFLGPNGAGKTTTIRILMGLLSSGSGEANVFGKPCNRFGKQIRRDVGYLAGDVHLYPGLTGRRNLEFLANARRQDCSAEIDRLADVFQLELHRAVRKYSTGMRQKLGLIQALMHRPKLLILDEPTSSLDPLIQQSVSQELRNVIADGRTVLFSSHSLNEVEDLCDEVIILRNGVVVEQQQIEILKKRALRKVEIQFSQSPPNEFPGPFRVLGRESKSVLGTWSGEISNLVEWLNPFSVADLIIERPDLNDLFMTYYSDSNQSPG